MLRESSKTSGNKFQLSDIIQGLSDKTEIDHGEFLVELTKSVVARDSIALKMLREKALDVIGNDGLVDAIAVSAAFHGFVRIADAIGIPYETAGFGNNAAEIREEAGINQFHRISVES
jgi:hypothetical protein